MPIFDAAILFSKTEGILPAPETAHAIKAAIEKARKNDNKCIVFNFSGHGHFDLASYEGYMSGKLEDFEYPAELVKESIKRSSESLIFDVKEIFSAVLVL